MIRCEDLSKRMGKQFIFQNLSCTFSEKLTYLSGPNGCGKSTLLLLLSGLEKPDKGEVIRLPDMKISLSMDAVQPPSVLTVEDVLSFQQQYQQVDLALQHYLIDTFQLKQHFGKRLSRLSTGTQKKLSLVCALSQRSNLVLLDEPCNGLDATSVTFIQEWVAQEHRHLILVDHQKQFGKQIPEVCL